MQPKSDLKFACTIDDIPPEYVLTLGKQRFVRFAGLQYLMDRLGVYKVQTNCIYSKEKEVLYEAKVWLVPSKQYLSERGIELDSPFVSILLEPTVMHATVNVDNTSTNMLKFRDCLAETRAIARAFRLVTGCPYTGLDELDKRDIRRMSEQEGISVETLEDMIIKESAPVAAPVEQTRPALIPYIKKMRDENKGVQEFINSYLDKVDCAIVENLTLDQLKDLSAKITRLVSGD